MAIITRAKKGSPLTHEEMDANFLEIKTLKNLSETAKSLSFYPTGTMDFSSIDIDTIVAFITIKGKTLTVLSDAYGNYEDDGYGNYSTSTKDYDMTIMVSAIEDGYGEVSLSFMDTYDNPYPDGVVEMFDYDTARHYFSDLDISIQHVQDLSSTNIDLTPTFIDGVV